MSNDEKQTGKLDLQQRELVSLGAAIASNCVPCIEYHIPAARQAGLDDAEVREAVELADRIRQVPAEKVLQTAFALIGEPCPARLESGGGGCGCG